MSVIFAFAMNGCDQNKAEQANASAAKRPAPGVSTMNVKQEDVEVALQFPAKLDSRQDVIVVAKVAGTLMEQYVKAGDFVKAGDKLFLIDPDKYQAAYNMAKAGVDTAIADINKTKRDFERATKLRKSRAISQKEYDATTSAYAMSKANLASAEASLENAALDLSYTVVTAPFDGVVGDKLKDVGSYINLQDPSLIRLTRLDPIDANFAIADTEYLQISRDLTNRTWNDGKMYVTTNYNGVDYNGTLIFVDEVINARTGSVDAKAEFKNTDGLLAPGTFSVVELRGVYQKNAFKIPSSSVQQGLVQPFVYILKDGVVRKADIKIVYERPDYVVVTEGLNDGDELILDNFQKIRVGAPAQKVSENK